MVGVDGTTETKPARHSSYETKPPVTAWVRRYMARALSLSYITSGTTQRGNQALAGGRRKKISVQIQKDETAAQRR